MQARITQPAVALPAAMQALQALDAASKGAGVPQRTLDLIHLRVSQINGCGVCVDGHTRILKKAGETEERVFALAAWRDTPYYTDAERAAFALAEHTTRLADRDDAVPDAVWQEAARHYDEKGLAALVLSIASINVWNRLNVATRQIAGQWKP
jgi:AhpD family alkylhydroperoxidase